MPVRAKRRTTAAAIALTAGITAGLGLMLTGCGSKDATGADGGSSPSATSSAKGNGAAADGKNAPSDSQATTPAAQVGSSGNGGKSASGVPVTSTSPKSGAPLNGTAHNGLTISDGTRFVVMNGTRVDFGTAVRDLSWSPDGRKAAFVDGDGDLVVSNPDGSGRTVVAKNPGDQNWSHPTWQVRKADSQYDMPQLNNLLFAGRANGVSRLYGVPAGGHNAKPAVLSLGHESGEGVKPLPQTGNTWPSAGGAYGDAVYANSADGQVYIRDDYLRQQGAAITHGSEPATAPSEEAGFVFVRSVGGHDHLFRETSGTNGPMFRDITPNATTDYTEPAFSLDGKTIAARTPDGIVTLPADGSKAPVKVSGYVGLPAYRG